MPADGSQSQPRGAAGSAIGVTDEAPIKVLTLHGVQAIEDKLLFETPRKGCLSAEVEKAVDDLARRLFGYCSSDVCFHWPNGYERFPEDSSEIALLHQKSDEFEDALETVLVDLDDKILILRELGLDFTDANGRPLRCTEYLSRTAEAAARGLMGRMPERASFDAEKLERDLTEAARKFRAQKPR